MGIYYDWAMDEPDFSKIVGFDWDSGNFKKSWIKHGVSPFESEQVFFNRPLIVSRDESHSQKEARFFVLGQTDSGRGLFIVFTARRDLIRVISAREMSRKERAIYENHEE